MDQLSLQSTFAKLRNPNGLRRWAYMKGSVATTVDFRLPQLFGHSGQPYGENNAPMIVTRVAEGETMAQLVPFRDQWERPAKRWFKVKLSGGTVSASSGTPFLAEDPFQTTVQYKAKAGDDIFLDDGAGTVVIAKIASVSPAGNAADIAPKQGVSLPATGTYYARHTLDAFLVPLTVSYMVPKVQASILDPGTHTDPFQSVIQVTYYDNGGSTVVEQYRRVPVRELSTIALDVPYAFIDVVGDRFDTPATPLTEYIQVFEVFEFALARVPDKLEVVFDNVGPTGGGTDVHVGNAAVYYGSNVPAAAQVPANIFPPNPNPPPSVRYNMAPPPDPEDYWTGSGDIVVMPVGTVCPAGFEDIAQLESKANDHYVVDTATGRPITFTGGTALTMSLVSGNTRFVGTIPATAVDPSTGTLLRNASNNTATYEVVFLPASLALNVDQPLAFRIPEIQFSSGGTFEFTLSGDVRSHVSANQVNAYPCRLFISGLVKADVLNAAGEYSKPTQNGTDATPIDDDASAFAPYDTRLSIPLDELLVQPGDIITFLDASGNDAAPIDTTGGGVFTGPTFVVKDVGPLNANGVSVPSDDNTVPLGDNEIVVEDQVGGHVTEVWRFVGDSAVPSVPQANSFKVFATSTNHTHAVGVGDAETKSRKDGGHFVTNVDHTHLISAQAVVAPYTKFKLCAKL